MQKNLKSPLMMLGRILDLRSILPTSLPILSLNETLAPPSSPPLSAGSPGENQEEAAPNDDSNSDGE